MTVTLLEGNCLETLKTLPAGSVQCAVTSPPYYGLRDYGVDGQLGLEDTPEAYVTNLVSVFREVWRVLADDGTLWLNLGDSYNGYPGNVTRGGNLSGRNQHARHMKPSGYGLVDKGLKPKDLIGIPWMVAFALRADGWYLRSEIIWAKPNPMPESVTDRPTKSHEQIFLLTKSAKYYYDADAIKEPAKDSSVARLSQDVENQEGSDRANGGAKTNGKMKAVKFGGNKAEGYGTRLHSGKEWRPTRGFSTKEQNDDMQHHGANIETNIMVNKRSVWTVTTKPYKEAHFATFPPDLIEPCILAGSREGDTVLDPFNGSGTTGAVSVKHRRNYIGCELNPEYIKLTHRRLSKVQIMMNVDSPL